MIYILLTLGTIALMLLPELLKNDTKNYYKEQGYNWSNVLICSSLAPIAVSAFLKASMHFFDITIYWQLFVFIIMSTFVLVQSLFTDIRTRSVNRKMLRAGILISLMLAISMQNFNLLNTIIFVLLNFLCLCGVLFLTDEQIGASDLRAMQLYVPTAFIMFGSLGILVMLIPAVSSTVQLIYNKMMFQVKGIPMVPHIALWYTLALIAFAFIQI